MDAGRLFFNGLLLYFGKIKEIEGIFGSNLFGI